MGEDVFVGAPRPEEARQRHVDHDQGGCQERDLAAEQAESAVDVAGEDLGKAVDDAGVHRSRSPRSSTDDSERPAAGVTGDCGEVFGRSETEDDRRGSKKRLRFASHTVLQMASLAASGPIELQRTSSASNAPVTAFDGPVTAFDGWVLPDCTCE